MAVEPGSQQPRGLRTRLTGSVRKRLSVVIVAGAVCCVVALALALPGKSRQAPPTEPPAVNVQVETVRAIPALADSFISHGVVEPARVVKVAAEVSGQIKAVGCRRSALTVDGKTYNVGDELAEGQPITKGDCIVILDTDLLQAEYDRAKAQADYDAREYARMVELFEKNVATKTELDGARTRMAVSRATLAEAAERLRRARIIAPIGGILNDLPQEVGQFVQPGACVAQIVDIDTAVVVVDVPERDVHYLKVADKAEVLIDAVDGRKTEGVITFISELADKEARTTRVEVSVANEDHLLRSGQSVRVRLVRRVLKDVIMVPLSAVIPLEKAKAVYVAEGDVARRREVVIDMSFIKGARVRVTAGLKEGDRLIVVGHRYVGDGQNIRVLPVEAGPAGGSAAGK